MKAILTVCLALAALLVVVLFFFWGARAHEEAVVSSRDAPEPSTSEAAPATSLAAAPASPSTDPARQTAVPPGALDDSGVRSDLPPLTDLASGLPPVNVQQNRALEDERFAKKYDTVSTLGRKNARASIDQYVRTHESGAEDQGRKVSEEEITALSHELEWLDSHPSP